MGGYSTYHGNYKASGTMYHGNHGTRVIRNKYLLDLFPNAYAAYSYRLLRSEYKGFCVKIRRADNATLDVGFKNGYIDSYSALLFIGSSNARIDTWYDQSGNGLNLTQASTANQPRFSDNTGVVRGPIYNKGGFFGIAYSNADQLRLINSSFSLSQPFTYFGVCSLSLSSGINASVLFDSYNNTQAAVYSTGTTEAPNNTWTSINGGTAVRGAITNTDNQLISGIINGTRNFDRNNSIMGNGNPGTNGLSGISVGHIRGNPNPLLTAYNWAGLINELVFYSGDRSTQKQQIDKNIMDYYNLSSYSFDLY